MFHKFWVKVIWSFYSLLWITVHLASRRLITSLLFQSPAEWFILLKLPDAFGKQTQNYITICLTHPKLSHLSLAAYRTTSNVMLERGGVVQQCAAKFCRISKFLHRLKINLHRNFYSILVATCFQLIFAQKISNINTHTHASNTSAHSNTHIHV